MLIPCFFICNNKKNIYAYNIVGGGKVNYIIPNWIAFIILAIGGLNWGLVGIFGFNLVEWIFGGYNVGSIIIYVLVLLSTIWLTIVALMKGYISFKQKEQ